jgi:transcriptional regulator GlxA family with amidase domain
MKNLKLVFALFFISVGVFAQTKNKIEIDKETFVCPPCDQSCDTITYDTKGKCPKCSMELVRKSKDLTVCFYLQDGVELLDFAGPMEVFVNAGFKVFTVSKTKDIITSQNVLKIMPDYSIEDAPYADVMAFFGGGTGSPSKDKALISWIQSRESKTPHIFSVCTGAFIVGRAGLLDNLTATTYYTHIEDLRKILPKTQVLENVRYVDNGNIITTAGISAGIDGALHFVAKIKGIDFAKTIAKEMEYDKWVPEQGLIIENK